LNFISICRESKEALQVRSLTEVENLLEFLESDEAEFRDETEIEKARADLQKAKNKLQRIIHGSPGLKIVFDYLSNKFL